MFAFFAVENSHGKFHLPWLAMLIIAIPVVLFVWLGAAPESLVFDRSAIAQGDYWRLITGHWVHSDMEHAIWDIAALAILLMLFDKDSKRLLLLAFCMGMMGVNIWLWFGNNTLEYYCGLSGILNTVLVVALWCLWRNQKELIILLVGLGAAGKIVIELSINQAILTETSWQSVPEVHAIGMLVGITIMLFDVMFNMKKIRI